MEKPKYCLSKESFVIENYNHTPAFSSFFPGIAGLFGCPMWVFYTNRAQCITSCGVLDKDGAIMEFEPANKACQTVALKGFRTFIKIDGVFYEPFRNGNKHEMHITPYDLTLIDINSKLKIQTEVNYFTIPNDKFPALARSLKIINLSRKKRKIEVIDGLPAIIPFGFDNDLLKKISQTISAWCVVENLEQNAPFYKLKVSPADVAETKVIERGNFFLPNLGKVIVDPRVVFGEHSSFDRPQNFMGAKNFKIPTQQLKECFIPCAMTHAKANLSINGQFELSSLFGQIGNIALLNKLKKALSSNNYFSKKAAENKDLINKITAEIKTKSSSNCFDLYAEQTYLDNVMRGGFPVNIGDKLLYIYYRKHGDMERDYNDFKLEPNYFSQGNGNYRDINQNRRCDVFFNPSIVEDNILRFFNLIQLDGFNPLVVLGSKFYLKSPRELIKKHLTNPPKELDKILSKPFILGGILKQLEESNVAFKTSIIDFAKELIKQAIVEEDAQHGEGFWTDHFSYNTDLLESYEAIYPEKIKELLLKQKQFTYFDNPHMVLDRKEKYCLVEGKVRQYESVKLDAEKAAHIASRQVNKHLVRTEFGSGEIYRTTLIAKILGLIACKAASFDAEGIGLEMEADKPDWYDALNGLPGLLGSSLSETLELKRLSLYVLKHLKGSAAISLPIEIKYFVISLSHTLNNTTNNYDYWDLAARLKEDFRKLTRLGVSGKEEELNPAEAIEFLNQVIKKCSSAVKKVLEKYGNYYTYFINEAADFELMNGDGIRIKKFNQMPLPLFLEGFVHALKVEKDKSIYEQVKSSPLYDAKLKNYKVNAPLKDLPLEIGRARVFTPGWLENESIWLHMEYKYMLELIRAGMYDEFFADFKKVLIPYLDPTVYKRSILENSSFIVSSAYPDKEQHGRGFVARLSGCCAEFIDIWLHMTSGKNIFSLDKNGSLYFKLSPILPAWLFDKGKFCFKLLGSIEVTYLNPKKQNTFGKGVSPKSYILSIDNKEINIDSPAICEPYASLIRDRKVQKIIVSLL